MNRLARIGQQYPAAFPILIVIMVLGIGITDYGTGYEISLFVFYLIPIALITLGTGWKAGILTSVLSTVVWFEADRMAGHPYSREFIPYWNAGMRLAFFILIVWSLKLIQHTYSGLEQRNTELMHEIGERRRAEEALRQAGDQLERRVRERTTALVTANSALQGEIAERRQAETELARGQQEAEVLAELVRVLNTSLDLETVLQRVTAGARELCQSDGVQIALRDPASDALLFQPGVGSPQDGQAVASPRVEAGRGLGGQVLASGQPCRTDGTATDARGREDSLDFAHELGMVSAMAVPIRIGPRIEGLLYVGNREPRPFTDRDEAILLRLADHAAIAIQNARLYAGAIQRQAELHTLLEINKKIGQSGPLASLLSTIAQEAARLLDVPLAVVRQREGDELVLASFWGEDVEMTLRPRVKIGENLAGLVGAHGQPIIIDDVRQSDLISPEALAFRLRYGFLSNLSVPLIAGDEVIGVLALQGRQERHFSPADVEMAMAFADQAVIAVRYARLYAEAERRRQAAERLAEVARLLSQSLDPTEVGQQIVEAISALLGATASVLFRREPGSGDLRAMALSGGAAPMLDQSWVLPQGSGVVGLAVRERRPIVSANSLADDRLTMPPEIRARLEQVPWRAVLAVPLMQQDEVIGVLSVGDSAGRVFTEEEIHLAQAFADQAATALENARLFQEAQQAYRDLTQTQAQLIQAQKMEAVGRLAGGIAHDFNNLLTVIIGRTQLLLLRLPSENQARRDAELVRSTACRAAELTQQLLAFSRRQMLQPRLLNLNTLVSNLSSMLRRLIGEDIELVTAISPSPGWVNADPGQIEQVLMNLTINTRDAMPQGGQLSIETANVLLDRPASEELPNLLPGRYVRLSVRDTGVGMDAETRSHLFEPFFTTKEPGRGTGLGLATVYGIVQQSGGHITVDSEPGQGATFTIYLPQIEQAVESLESATSDVRPTCGQETILLAEDEAAVRELAAEILQQAGYTVLQAEHGPAALRVSLRHEAPIQLLLTDVVMPGMNGRELADRLRQVRPGLQILYMSGYTDEVLGRHGVVDSSIAFLQKPFTADALLRAVRGALEPFPPA